MNTLEMIPDLPPELRSGISRLSMIRRVLGLALASGTALTADGLLTAGRASAQSAGLSTTDIGVLNFALNLEYLEAEFYSVAVTGNTIEQNGANVSGTGTPGGTTGGTKVTFSNALIAAVANEIYQDELTHVKFLQTTLGSQAIAKPAINLNGLGATTSAQSNFLMLSRAFEDTGVSAYGGSATTIQSTTVLMAAAQILATEAYHAGAIRTFVTQTGVATMATDGQDILPPPSGTKEFPVDSNGLSVIRTPGAVINIVKPFFPSGINGTVQS